MSGISNDRAAPNINEKFHTAQTTEKTAEKIKVENTTKEKIIQKANEKFDSFSDTMHASSLDLDMADLDFIDTMIQSTFSNLDEAETIMGEVATNPKIEFNDDSSSRMNATKNKLIKMLPQVKKESVQTLCVEEIEKKDILLSKMDRVIDEKEFKAFLPIESSNLFEQISLKKVACLPEQLQKTAIFVTMRDGKVQINQEQHHKLKEHLHDGELKIKDEKGNTKSMSVTLMTPEEEVEFQKLLKLKNRYVRIVQVRARLLLLQQKIEKQSPNDFSAHVHNIIHNLQYISAPNYVHKKVRHCIEKFVKKIEINRENDQKRHLEKMIERKKIESYERAKQYEKTEQKKNAKAQKRLDTDISKEEIAKGLANEELKDAEGRKVVKPNPVKPQNNNAEMTPIPGQVPKKASSIIL